MQSVESVGKHVHESQIAKTSGWCLIVQVPRRNQLKNDPLDGSNIDILAERRLVLFLATFSLFFRKILTSL